MSSQPGGRIFFSSAGRSLAEEDQITILTAGVDIGSSTSHLVFSRIVLELLDSRYVIASREVLYESSILMTPYADGESIDASALGQFIDEQYRLAGVNPEKIDTGALILTGVAARRNNSRAIGELFAKQAGRMVAVSAGDNLEAVMAAHGSGAVARSRRDHTVVLNVDVGGGTTKIALCADGKVIAQTALDIGARLVCVDGSRRIVRIEAAAHLFAADLGFAMHMGEVLGSDRSGVLAELMADRLMEVIAGGSPVAGGTALLRAPPLPSVSEADCVTVSGGVSEYFYGNEKAEFGDLGRELASAIRRRLDARGMCIETPDQRIRATVIGASQYTTQVSGGTIYVSPLHTLPLRNVPVIAPDMGLAGDVIESGHVSRALRAALDRLDLGGAQSPVAVFAPWRGSATFSRLDAFCRGVVDGLADILEAGHPIVLAGDGDTGGLIGIHFHEELQLACPVVSIDSLELREFDYIDIGGILEYSGAVPVVIKSLVFPGAGETRTA
jgi:ethanolamine utilization protein EutA